MENSIVSMVSYSQIPDSSILKTSDLKTLQDIIVYCARVSNPENQTNSDTGNKLIDYLIRNEHWSPFEMVSATLQIITTRDISRQILRHRSFSFQEFSLRYQSYDPLNFVVREARKQDTRNRQNSIEVDDTVFQKKWIQKQEEIITLVNKHYEWALLNGIAKEQARVILPEGMVLTKLYMNGTIRSWIHYIKLRSGNGTQKEHREVAISCADVLGKEIPKIFDFVEKE